MEIIGFLAGTITILVFVPQAIKTITTRNTRDLSLLSYVLLFSANALWVAYGIEKHALAIVVADGVVTATAALILLLIISDRATRKARLSKHPRERTRP